MDPKLFEKYNFENSLLVIAGFPKKNETYSQGVCAVSSFTKNSLLALKKENSQREIVVLTMTIDGKKEIYEEDGMLIVRCFDRNKPFSFLNILNYAQKFNKTRNVFVEFEFSSFGDTFSTSLFIPLLYALRFSGKNITIIMHQVILDLKKLYGHIGLSHESALLSILNIGFRFFYRLACLPASKIVVLEDELKQRLSRFTNSKKIVVIPHGVDVEISNEQANIRKKLGFYRKDFVVLYFGFLTWYKGVDFLIKSFSKLQESNIKLLVAGGPSFTQNKKKHYQKFLSKVYKLAKTYNVKITGFVAEKDIAGIFKASDLVIFPYRAFMSSSGPLSMAISFQKPLLLSENLYEILQSPDIKRVMDQYELTHKDFVFKETAENLIEKVQETASSPLLLEKLSGMSKSLSQVRSFEYLAMEYDKILENENIKVSPNFIPAASSD